MGNICENIACHILYSNVRSMYGVVNACQFANICREYMHQMFGGILYPQFVGLPLFLPMKAGQDQIAIPER